MATGDGPRFSRLRVGEELRRLRNARGYSQVELGARVGASGARISRLETGDAAPDLALVMNVLDVLEVAEPDQRRLIAIARLANEQTWWKVSGMPSRQAAFAELESTARVVSEYAMVFVPGLLQTPEYMKVRYADREAAVPVDEDAASAGRQQRQEVLTRPKRPIDYRVLLDETVLRRATAPPAVMRGQWQHLLDLAELSNVDIRIVPLDATVAHHAPALNSFALYEVSSSSRVAIVETETTEVQTSDSDQTQRYVVLYQRLLEAALSTQQSLQLIRGAAT